MLVNSFNQNPYNNKSIQPKFRAFKPQKFLDVMNKRVDKMLDSLSKGDLPEMLRHQELFDRQCLAASKKPEVEKSVDKLIKQRLSTII